MSKSFLGNYKVSSAENILYQLDFEIPENCEYFASFSNNIHTVKICLKEGEREPATIYVPYQLEFTMVNNVLTIEFDQECEATTTTRKPIIKIDY